MGNGSLLAAHQTGASVVRAATPFARRRLNHRLTADRPRYQIGGVLVLNLNEKGNMKTWYKSRLLAASLCVACLSLASTGCTTVNPATGQAQFDPVKTEDVKAALEVPVVSAIRRTILNSPQHALEISTYFRSLGKIFCSMEATTNFSPATLMAQADALLSPRLKESYLIEIKDSIVLLYKLNYNKRFTAELPPDQWAYQTSSFFCAAIDRGLKTAGQPGVNDLTAQPTKIGL